MPRLLIFLIVLLIAGGGGFYLYGTFLKQPPKTTTQTTKATSSPATTQLSNPCEVLVKGSADLPPLYSGVSWNEPLMTKEEIIEYDEDNNSTTVVLEGCAVKAIGVDYKHLSKFDDNYYEVFKRDNWKIINDFGGPEGSTATHKKDDKYLLLEDRIDKASTTNEKKYNLKVFYSQ